MLTPDRVAKGNRQGFGLCSSELCSSVALSVALAGGLFGSGCNKTQQQRTPTTVPSGQTIKISAFPDYFGHNTFKAFEAATGNKVELTTYPTNEALLSAIAGGARYDVIFPSSYALERLLNQGQIADMQRERVPNLVHISQEFRNPPFDPSMSHCAPYVWWLAGLGVYVNPATPGRVPDSWKPLLDPSGSDEFKEWESRPVVMLDDMRATLGVALRSLGLSASSQSAADLDAAQRLLAAQLPRVHDYLEDPVPLILSQKVSLGLSWSADVKNVARDKPNLRFIVPREGTLLYVDYACVMRGSGHTEVGFAFLNHLLDPAVSAEISNTRMLATPNVAARPLLEGEARWLWASLEALVGQGKSRYELMRDVGAAQPLYDKAWHTLKEKLAAQKAERKAAEEANPGAVEPSAGKAATGGKGAQLGKGAPRAGVKAPPALAGKALVKNEPKPAAAAPKVPGEPAAATSK